MVVWRRNCVCTLYLWRLDSPRNLTICTSRTYGPVLGSQVKETAHALITCRASLAACDGDRGADFLLLVMWIATLERTPSVGCCILGRTDRSSLVYLYVLLPRIWIWSIYHHKLARPVQARSPRLYCVHTERSVDEDVRSDPVRLRMPAGHCSRGSPAMEPGRATLVSVRS